MSDRLVEERLSRIAEQVAQAQRNSEATEQVREQADSLEVEGSSKGGEVTVVVDAAGRVRDVRFTAASQVLNPSQLGLPGVFRTLLVFLLQAAFVKSRNSRSTSLGARYPRAE